MTGLRCPTVLPSRVSSSAPAARLRSLAGREDSLLACVSLITLVAILFCSGSAAGLCYSSLKLPVLFAVFVVWAIAFVARLHRIFFTAESLFAFGLILAAVLVGSTANGELRRYSFAIIFLTVVDAYLVSVILGPRRVLQGFVAAMVFLGAASLVGYVFVALDSFPPLPSMPAENGKTVYLNGMVFCIDTILNRGRSIGIFWEPSIMAGYLNVALFLALVMDVKCPRFGYAILCLSLLATMSSGGLIGFLFVIAAFVYKRNGNALTTLAIVLAVALFLIFYDQIEQLLLGVNYEFFYKFFGGSASGTTQTRLDSPLVNLRIWALSPLFGSGLDGASALYSTMRLDSTVTNMAQTSTMAVYLASFGVLGVFYTVFWLRALFRLKGLPLVSRLFGLALFVLFLNEIPCTQFMALYILLFSLLGDDAAGPSVPCIVDSVATVRSSPPDRVFGHRYEETVLRKEHHAH